MSRIAVYMCRTVYKPPPSTLNRIGANGIEILHSSLAKYSSPEGAPTWACETVWLLAQAVNHRRLGFCEALVSFARLSPTIGINDPILKNDIELQS